MNKGGKIHCALLIAKSRLAPPPLKTITIPCLELSAANVSVRLDKMMTRELPVDQSFFWTDSTAVLKYIANRDKRFHTFVANRVAQILDGSSPGQWRRVHQDESAGSSVNVIPLMRNAMGCLKCLQLNHMNRRSCLHLRKRGQ